MRILIPIVAAAVALTTACGSDMTSPAVSISGTWTLRTLNGSPLPYAVGPSTLVIGEVLTLNPDGSYNDVASYSDGSYYRESGYFTVNNNAITFDDISDNITYQGSISGSVLTEISGQYTSVYQKQ